MAKETFYLLLTNFTRTVLLQHNSIFKLINFNQLSLLKIYLKKEALEMYKITLQTSNHLNISDTLVNIGQVVTD